MELKKDSAVFVRVRENNFKLIASSYSNTQMRAFVACRGSCPGECCISPASNTTRYYKEKLWDLHVAPEREMPQMNY